MVQTNNTQILLGKILGTQEAILQQLKQYSIRLEKHIEDDAIVKDRVQKLETKISYATGWAVAAITGITIMSNLILTKWGLK